MSIDIERFERESSFGPEETLGRRVLAFLDDNDERAFDRAEIADATGIDPDVVSSVLSRLKSQGLVRHKRPYWAACGPEQMVDGVASSPSWDDSDDRCRPEDWDDRFGFDTGDGRSGSDVGDGRSGSDTGAKGGNR